MHRVIHTILIYFALFWVFVLNISYWPYSQPLQSHPQRPEKQTQKTKTGTNQETVKEKQHRSDKPRKSCLRI